MELCQLEDLEKVEKARSQSPHIGQVEKVIEVVQLLAIHQLGAFFGKSFAFAFFTLLSGFVHGALVVHTAQWFLELENLIVSKVLEVLILKQHIITKLPGITIFQPLQISSSINTSTSSASSILKWIAELEVMVVVVLKGIKVKHQELFKSQCFQVEKSIFTESLPSSDEGGGVGTFRINLRSLHVDSSFVVLYSLQASKGGKIFIRVMTTPQFQALLFFDL
ncbi:hypothetical protein F5146DRAFT_1005394 [Armillaria mellea]|nr:hypothetical protein F5146DRAFT_1005394 [Armillaria mellea]